MLVILLVFSMLTKADDFSQQRLLHIDLTGFPLHKVCIYKNDVFSEGSEIKMANQKLYRCERIHEGKTGLKETVYLRWMAVTYPD